MFAECFAETDAFSFSSRNERAQSAANLSAGLLRLNARGRNPIESMRSQIGKSSLGFDGSTALTDSQ